MRIRARKLEAQAACTHVLTSRGLLITGLLIYGTSKVGHFRPVHRPLDWVRRISILGRWATQAIAGNSRIANTTGDHALCSPSAMRLSRQRNASSRRRCSHCQRLQGAAPCSESLACSHW